ncbi:MAG TPA: hypothetical protein V6C85_26650 [Allocoleopsis sp.]
MSLQLFHCIACTFLSKGNFRFRDAAERFGIGAYLDEQKGKGKDRFIQYMNSKGDKRAEQFTQENEWKDAGAMGEKQQTNNPQNRVITFKQANRLHAIASSS